MDEEALKRAAALKNRGAVWMNKDDVKFKMNDVKTLSMNNVVQYVVQNAEKDSDCGTKELKTALASASTAESSDLKILM